MFNIYTVSNDIDVNVAFEGMNNRGKPLSTLELLKNRLIYLSVKIDDDQHERMKLRNAVNEAWKSIYHELGRNKQKPLDDDTFLLNHFFYYFSNFLKLNEDVKYRLFHRRLASDYKEYLLENLFNIKRLNPGDEKKSPFTIETLETRLIYGYVASLKSSVETWFSILNPTKSSFSEDEIRLLQNIYRIKPNAETELFMVLVLVFFEKIKDEKERVNLLALIEKMLFFNTLTSYKFYLPLDDFNDEFFLELAVELAKDKKTPNGVLNELHDKWRTRVTRTDLIKEIVQQFKGRGFYTWDGLRYFLFEYEMHLKNLSKSERSKLDWEEFNREQEEDYTTIEHIYPQTARKKCWSTLFEKYSQQQRYALKDSLGNLVPLSKAKNSSLGNRCFEEKKNNDYNTVGYCYGCYSENQVALQESWTALNILTRGIEMTYFLQQRWEVSFESREQVIEFLGLEFLVNKDHIDIDNLYNSLGFLTGDIKGLTKPSSGRAKGARH